MFSGRTVLTTECQISLDLGCRRRAARSSQLCTELLGAQPLRSLPGVSNEECARFPQTQTPSEHSLSSELRRFQTLRHVQPGRSPRHCAPEGFQAFHPACAMAPAGASMGFHKTTPAPLPQK